LEEKIIYFEESGEQNTEETLRLAAERAKARGIKKIVLSSTRGETAKLAAERWAGTGIKIIVVPHQFGFISKTQKFPPELVAELNKKGHIVHFGTMLFHAEHFFGTNIPRVMANLLRTFCQGMKVCVEILLMVTDAGHVDIGENVVVVTGTRFGADTAVVAIASTSTRLTDLRITEIICKPFATKSILTPPIGSE
jgi:uncharacterized protein